jgi:hypothetical protein
LRAVGLETVKLDPAVRDMLPLVKSAQDAFVSGMNPYDLHQMQRGSVVPLTYLPGMWLIHGIPRLVGLDLRWMGIIADAVVASMLWWAASGVDARYRATARGLALAFAAAWLFSPSVHWNGLYAEPHAWWLVLAVVLAATVRRCFWLAAAALGVALATRHFALVIAPFVILHIWRTLGWRAALARAGLTGAIAAILLVWFAAPDPEMFWFGTYRWLVEYGPAHQSWFWFKFGFSGPLYKANAAEWLPRAQLLIVLAMLALAAFVRGPRAFLAPAGTAYVGFVMFNGIIWDSFYLGAALFPAFAAAAAHPTPHAAPIRLERRSFVLGAAAAVLSAIAGGWLIVTLVQSSSSSGKGALRHFLAREVRPGDTLVDRSDFQLAFVRGKPVFASTPAPTRAVGDNPFGPSFGPGGALEAPRLWLVTHGQRDAPLRAQLEALGTPREQHFGRYRVTSLEPGTIQSRLSALTSELSPTFNNEPLTPTGVGSWRSARVTYVEVTRRLCRIGGAPRVMLFTQPAIGGTLRLSFANVALGSALVIFGGIDDNAVLWGRADVDVAIAIDGKVVGDLRLRNRPGAEWIGLDTSRYADGVHRVELMLRTKNDLQRFACLEGLVLGRPADLDGEHP